MYLRQPTADVPAYKPLFIPPADLERPEETEAEEVEAEEVVAVETENEEAEAADTEEFEGDEIERSTFGTSADSYTEAPGSSQHYA